MKIAVPGAKARIGLIDIYWYPYFSSMPQLGVGGCTPTSVSS